MNHAKITIVYESTVKTFKQLAEGESLDEFRSRAVCALNMPEEARYYYFEDERGGTTPGPVHNHVCGVRRIYHLHAQDDRLPGLFTLTDGWLVKQLGGAR